MRRDKYWAAVRFFKEHAGYSTTGTESIAQGKLRTARALAAAERYAWVENITFSWEDDWSVGSHIKEFDSYETEPTTCEVALAYNVEGKVIASLGCIDDADTNYRRVVNAELALEVMST